MKLRKEEILEKVRKGVWEAIMQSESPTVGADDLLDSFRYYLNDFLCGIFDVRDEQLEELREKIINDDELCAEIEKVIIEEANEAQKIKVRNMLNDILETYEAPRMFIIYGVSVVGEYKVHPRFVILDNGNAGKDIKEKKEILNLLEKLGVAPHAFGILAYYPNWANYGALKYEKGQEIDDDYLELYADFLEKWIFERDELHIFKTKQEDE